MIVTLHTAGLGGLEEIRGFLKGSAALGFEAPARPDANAWIAGELRRLQYPRLGRAGRGLIRAYLAKVSGVSRAQLSRLIGQFTKTGRVVDRRAAPEHRFNLSWTLPLHHTHTLSDGLGLCPVPRSRAA